MSRSRLVLSFVSVILGVFALDTSVRLAVACACGTGCLNSFCFHQETDESNPECFYFTSLMGHPGVYCYSVSCPNWSVVNMHTQINFYITDCTELCSSDGTPCAFDGEGVRNSEGFSCQAGGEGPFQVDQEYCAQMPGT